MERLRTEVEPIANLGSESIRKFAESIAGEIILPDAKRYQKARRVWNHAAPSLISPAGFRRPKNNGPDQRVPVISRATSESEP